MLQGFELQIQKTLFSVTIKNDWVLFKKPKKPFMKKPILAILGSSSAVRPIFINFRLLRFTSVLYGEHRLGTWDRLCLCCTGVLYPVGLQDAQQL
jgi:hypothetical protein